MPTTHRVSQRAATCQGKAAGGLMPPWLLSTRALTHSVCAPLTQPQQATSC